MSGFRNRRARFACIIAGLRANEWKLSGMRILSFEAEPFYELPYRNAAPGGGVEIVRLPVLRAYVEGMPPEVEAILAVSDLQGLEQTPLPDHSARLAGEVLAEELATLAGRGAIPPADR